MTAEPIVLFDNGHHKCLMFDSLVTGEGVQSNQFLVVDGQHEALIDPGGDLTYTPLSVAASRYMNIREMDYVFASHQDPDIIGAIDRWIVHTPGPDRHIKALGPVPAALGLGLRDQPAGQQCVRPDHPDTGPGSPGKVRSKPHRVPAGPLHALGG